MASNDPSAFDFDINAHGGWVDDQAAVQATLARMPMPLFADAAPHLAGTGAGKNILLYLAWKEVLGGWFQYPAQQIGCCVSRGFSEGVDLLECVQIALGHKSEKFEPTSHEAVYGMARVDIGGGRLIGDGAVGAWASEAVTKIGTIPQKMVGPYSDVLAKKWGRSGVPDEIKSHAGEHKVGASSLVTTTDQCDDALANGYPVPVCSNRGFTTTRDKDGFCYPRGVWPHCMLICGVRVDIPGYCIMQSWGMDNPTGPLALDQPPNSFWAPKDTVARMLAAQDSWTLSSFQGYPGQPLPSSWTYAGFA